MAAAFEYSKTVLEHYQNPRNVGELTDATNVGTAGNPKDGDYLRLAFRVRSGRIEAVCFQTLGCPAAIAAGSAATELLAGKSVEQALSLANADVIAYLGGLPPSKHQCSVLVAQATRAAFSPVTQRLSRENTP